MFLTHRMTGCDGMWVQAPGSRVPDDQVYVSASLYACLTCLLSCLVGFVEWVLLLRGFIVVRLCITSIAVIFAVFFCLHC